MKHVKILVILSTLILLILNSILAQDVEKKDTAEKEENKAEKPKEENTFTGIPKGFRVSSDPHSWGFSGTSIMNSNGANSNFSSNKFASVDRLNLSQAVIFDDCNAKEGRCSENKEKIEIWTEANDPENDVLTYELILRNIT